MNKIKLKNYPIGPFPTVLVGTEVDDRPNYVTVGACGVVCLEPLLYISLKSTHFSTRGVKESGFFSVNIPSGAMVVSADYAGMVSGKTTDKSGLFTAFYEEGVRTPLIKECPLNFLCKVVQTFPVSGFEMFFGEIISVYINEACLSEDQPDPLKINPIIMMGNGYFNLGSQVGTIFKTGKGFK